MNEPKESLHVYCDESCHLEHDGKPVMVLGAVWCPAAQVRDAHLNLRNLKRAYGLADGFEMKWTKVSPAKMDFYRAALDFFFRSEHLYFRALVVPDKAILNHAAFPGQTHDDWYYKMYFHMLAAVLQPEAEHRVFLDYKDTKGAAKARKLHDVLCNSIFDFRRKAVVSMAVVHSQEVGLLQLADLLIGAVGYANRGETGSPAKLALVEDMRRRSGYSLAHTTFLKESKTNILVWRPRETAP